MTPADLVELRHAASPHSHVTWVDWNLGPVCNYSCSYCPPHLHSGPRWSSTYVALADFGVRLTAHYTAMGQRLFVQFTGGEPTLFPRLLDLAGQLRADGASVAVLSNGSRPLAWWETAAAAFDAIGLSFHIEEAVPSHFTGLLALLASCRDLHVNVCMLPSRLEECLDAARLLRAATANATMTLKPLTDADGRLSGYTEEELALLRDPPAWLRAGHAVDRPRGRMLAIDIQGGATPLTASRILATGANTFEDWWCAAGIERLTVSSDGRVFRGVCRVGGMLGRLDDPSWLLPSTGIRCTAPRCSCLADLMVTKRRSGPA